MHTDRHTLAYTDTIPACHPPPHTHTPHPPTCTPRGYTVAKQTNATLAQYLWEATPYARFIVLFRDPVDRYYSAYYYYRWVWLDGPSGMPGGLGEVGWVSVEGVRGG